MAGSGDRAPIGAFPTEATETLVEQLGAAFLGDGEDDHDLARRIADRPALLWRERWPELQAFAAAQSPQVCEAVLGAIGVLEDIEAQIAAKQGGWAVGGGPLEQLARQVSEGLLSEDEARITLGKRDIIWRMSPDYVRRCAMRAAYLAQGETWQFALIFSRLTLVAADGYPVENVRCEMQEYAVDWWMATATAACIQVPDGAVFPTREGAGTGAAAQAAGSWREGVERPNLVQPWSASSRSLSGRAGNREHQGRAAMVEAAVRRAFWRAGP